MRDRLPLKQFIEKLFTWIVSWGVEYDSGAQTHFVEEPTINHPLWTKSYQWVRLNKVVNKLTDTIMLVPSGESIQLDAPWVENSEFASFDEFKKNAFRAWRVDTSENEWMKWTCNCPVFKKEYICKHVIGIALRLKEVKAPIEAKTVSIGSKRKRGRPAKAKKALLVQ